MNEDEEYAQALNHLKAWSFSFYGAKRSPDKIKVDKVEFTKADKKWLSEIGISGE